MKLIQLLCLSFVVYSCNAHGAHDHHHEDEDVMIQAGKEKWFKKPDDTAHEHAAAGHQHGHHVHHHDHSHDHDHHHDHSHDHDHHHGHGESHFHHHHHGAHDHGHHHHGHAHAHGHGHDHGTGCPHAKHGAAHVQDKKSLQAKKARTITETVDMWWQAIFATVLISAAPFFILFFVPLESNAEKYQPMLKVLLSFASGGLLGDAFLHLIPHAIHPHTHGEHSHDHDHNHGHDHSATTIVGLWVLAGIVSFLAVEKFVRHAKGGHHHHHHNDHHGDNNKKEEESTTKTDEKTSGDETADEDKAKEDKSSEKSQSTLRKRKKDSESESKKEDDDPKDKTVDKSNTEAEEEGMKVAGFLNLAADFTHNFTDGLAIGASFLGGQTLGIITTLTILLHEVPHEIGDFAILVQSGCNKRKAMFLQLSTATGAMAGCILGLLAENIGDAATSWILPFTAGGFIYIATVSVIPELLVDAKPKQSIKEILAMFVGIAMMVLIGFLE